MPKFDWKYLLGLLVAVAGVGVAVWPELKPHSLKLRVVSQTALQPQEMRAMTDLNLKITVDGVELKSPYLSVLELMNDGTKSIAAGDFESPLELRVEQNLLRGLFSFTVPDKGRFKFGEPPAVVRAAVSGKSPPDLEPVLVSDAKVIKLKPLLLNPKDTITLSIITSGGLPDFKPRARIAGVSAIPVEDATRPTPPRFNPAVWIESAFALLLLVASQITYGGFWKPSAVSLSRHAALFVTVLTLVGAVAIGLASADRWGLSAWYDYVGLLVIFVPIAALLGLWLNRRSVAQKDQSAANVQPSS